MENLGISKIKVYSQHTVRNMVIKKKQHSVSFCQRGLPSSKKDAKFVNC